MFESFETLVHQWKVDRKIWNKVFNREFIQSSFGESVSQWSTTERGILEKKGQPIQCLIEFKKHFISTLVKCELTNEKTNSKFSLYHFE